MFEKLRKTVAFVLVLSVLISMLCVTPVVHAAVTDTTEINGWKFAQYSGNDSFHASFKEKASMSVSDEWARSGNKSLKVVYTEKPSGAVYQLYLYSQSLGILEPGTYSFSYTIHAVDENRKSLDKLDTANSINGPRKIYQGLFNSIMTIGSANPSTVGNYTGDELAFGNNAITEFTTITRKFTLAPGYGAAVNGAPSQANIDKFLYFLFEKPLNSVYSKVAAIYLDDIILKKVDASGNPYGENLLVNGSFENNAVQTPSYGEKEVKNEVAMGVAGKISLTWTNPSTAALSNVEIYETTDGTETKLEVDLNKDANGKNTVYLTDQARSRHYYKVVNTYTDGTKTEHILSADASAVVRNYTMVNGWTVVDNKDTALNKSSATLDKRYVKSGNTSLHLKSNKSSWLDSDTMILRTNVKVPVDYTVDDYYKLSMWVKKNKVNGFYARLNDTATNGAFPGFKVLGTDGTTTGNNFYLVQASSGTTTVWTHGWQYFETIFKTSDLAQTWTAGANMQFNIKLFNGAEDIWIDDVSLVKCDSAGCPVSGAAELMANGGFEVADDYVVEGFEAGDVNAVAGDGEITVSYGEIASGKKVNVYFRKTNGALDFKGSLYEDKTSYTFKNLENETEYKIVFAQADVRTGLEQETPVEVSATPMPPAYVIGEYVIKNSSGAMVGETIIPDTYSATIDVKNNTVTEGFPACFIYAVYEGNTLVDVDYQSENIMKGNSKKFELTNIKVGQNQTFKLFLWEDFDTLNILKKHWAAK